MICATNNTGYASRCIKFCVLALVGIGAVTGIVMFLWNSVLPDLFSGVSPIGYWQALGLLVLSRLLFGGLRGGFHRHWRDHSPYGRAMTEDERQQLKARFHGRWSKCCFGTCADASAGDGNGDGDASTRG